jgi:Holliday junction resolvase RusA-like endonuclease
MSRVIVVDRPPAGNRAKTRANRVDDGALYPLEFYIQGTPRSLRTSRRSKEEWKANVRAAARQRVHETDDLGLLDERPLALTIFYFPAAPMEGDVDNIVKLIMDALIFVAYLDDRVVERVLVQKFEQYVDKTIAGRSIQLSMALNADRPVVYVRVDDDLRWRAWP